MKDLFSWRLEPSEQDFKDLWESATFVFDTNFILDLHRITHPTVKDFLNILEHLKERIWLPYQVVDEYFNRREEVIESETKSFQKASESLERWKKERLDFSRLKGFLRGCFKSREPSKKAFSV